MNNLLTDLNACGFGRMNNPDVTELEGGAIRFSCGPRVDMFQDTQGNLSNDTAPFLYKETEGDFACTVFGEHGFTEMYDAYGILVWHDKSLFAKLCYEGTDFGTRSVVNVVTNVLSDDSNGVIMEGDGLWLRVSRVGNVFVHEYSENGMDFFLTRRYYLDIPKKIKVGVLVQSPIGKGTTAEIRFFELK